MPQLDILLFFSQSFSGVIFVSGFLYFSKVLLPYISFFVKFEEKKQLAFLKQIKTLFLERDCLNGSRNLNKSVLKYAKSWIVFFEKKIFINSVLLQNR